MGKRLLGEGRAEELAAVKDSVEDIVNFYINISDFMISIQRQDKSYGLVEQR